MSAIGIPNVDANLIVALPCSPTTLRGLEVTALDLIPIRLSPRVSQSTAFRKNTRFSGYWPRKSFSIILALPITTISVWAGISREGSCSAGCSIMTGS